MSHVKDSDATSFLIFFFSSFITSVQSYKQRLVDTEVG